MAIFVIGDLHLSLGASKPMDIFQGWENYVPRLEENWRKLVKPEDMVVLAGDTSWGMSLKESCKDFLFLEQLPGRKLLLKGNHDYWWGTVSKMQAYLTEIGCKSISFLHNNCVAEQGVMLCGTRGWMFDQGQQHDEKMMVRECGRLRFSLSKAVEQAPHAPRIVFLHYPPVCAGAQAKEITDILKEFSVRHCYYGHLHGAALRRARQGMIDGVEYHLISADGVRFCPVKI